MRILIAGASGAIGRPLVHRLRASRHEVFALARSPDSRLSTEIGVVPVIADALNAAAVKAAVERIRPEAVINELTSLPRHYTAAEMEAATERDRKVRVEGNANLLVALRDAGVRRYLLQSSGFWYRPGAGLADESVPFICRASPGVEAGARTYRELEARASATPRTRVRRATLRILLRPRYLVHARGRYWRSVAATAASHYRRGPGRLQLRAYRRRGRGDRCRAGVPARSVQHRRRKPVALSTCGWRRSHVLQEHLRHLASTKKRRFGRQALMRSITRRGLGALRTRKPGASSSSARARLSGFRQRALTQNNRKIRRLPIQYVRRRVRALGISSVWSAGRPSARRCGSTSKLLNAMLVGKQSADKYENWRGGQPMPEQADAVGLHQCWREATSAYARRMSAISSRGNRR